LPLSAISLDSLASITARQAFRFGLGEQRALLVAELFALDAETLDLLNEGFQLRPTSLSNAAGPKSACVG